jgi:hypothetical protein
MPKGALYYPYTTIQDVNWLKGNLLLFDSMSRMLPPEYRVGLNDDYLLTEFENVGLLVRANLFSEGSFAAQEVLKTRFCAGAEDPEFLRRYGPEAAQALLTPADPYGFQIHRDKSTFPLRETLCELGLAWEPMVSEPQDLDHRYVQMHPRVGQVVMSTIAVASAQSDGLDIVGDKRSGPLHRVLLAQDLDRIYDAWLGEAMPIAPSPADEEEVFEFLIASTADVSQLVPEQLKELDREPLTALLEAIKREASEIPAMDPGPNRTERFVDVTSRILSEWRTDRQNLSPSWKNFFGGGGAKEATDFIKKGADGVTMAIGGAAGGEVTMRLLAGQFEQGLFAAGGSLVIGLATTAVRGRRRLRDKAAHSPYRYLTLLEQNGVVFCGAESASCT